MFEFTGNDELAPPEPPSVGSQAITAKHAALKQGGFDLGPAQSNHLPAGDGGLVRAYANGRIYWSSQTGAHEVHGGILQKYISQGEAGIDPGTNRLLFGFPVTDEVHTLDPRHAFPVSYFQHGAIFWIRGVGAVSVYGAFYQGAFAPIAQSFPADYPIADPVAVAGGHALHFGHYTLFVGPATDNKIIELFFAWPQIGRPWVLQPAQSFPLAVVVRVEQDGWGAIVAQQPNLLAQIIDARFVLQQVSKPDEVLTLTTDTQSPQVVGPILRAFPNIPLQALGDLPARLVEMLDAATGARQESRIGQQSVPVISFATIAAAGSGADFENALLRMISTNQLNNAPSLLDPLLPVDPLPPIDPPDPLPPRDIIRFSLDLACQGAQQPATRTLYNIGYRLNPNKTFLVAPHAAYARNDWTNFGFLHITDVHVSRRIDHFAQKLRQAGKNAGADSLNNWNDAFRDLIRYANHLHERNLLDIILATGDLVDYEYEWSANVWEPEDRSRLYSWSEKGESSNWEFLRQLLLGNVPYPDQSPSLHEELRVPIFTTLGNHDYRSKPYALAAEVKKLGLKKDIEQYPDFNLTLDEARALVGGSISSISTAEAAKAIYAPDRYIGTLGPPRYSVALGPHRIVMLDTGRDAGLFDSELDALLAAAEFNTEDKNNLAAGAPNSVGVDNDEINLLRSALLDAGDAGLVIVGMHAPPLNPKGSEYPHYFRESEHATADKREIIAYLARQGALHSLSVWDEWQLLPQGQNGTFSLNFDRWQLRATPYFKRGGINNLLDWSVASPTEGQTLRLLEMCVGQAGNVGRAVDLVLFGHVHRNVEYRLEWDSVGQELLYFMDFYTENPAAYYQVRKNGFAENVHVRVRNIPMAGSVRTVRDNRPDVFWQEWLQLDIPQYAESLNDASDPGIWWDTHRPLLCQTGALGPGVNTRKDKAENEHKPGPSFQGFRYSRVTNNRIAKMHYVTVDALRSNNFVMPWEAALTKPRPRPRPFPGRPGGGIVAPG